MSNLYVFAIGGSGSRVLRSLSMLMASGITSSSDIIPMIIDPDTSNGDLNRTVVLLALYENIHKNLKFNSTSKSKFFFNKVVSLGNDGNYLLPLVGTAGIKFDRYLNLGSMSSENQAFAKMLFSNANLSSTMNIGFKGNPNIGSVVLNQFTQSDAYKSFESNFVKGDKVFIVSSIFGGTGASGFPLLLKSMRTSTNTDLRDAPIGAVSLLPYFNLKPNGGSKIQADSFVTKTKAALNYYEKNVTGNNTLNDMYYLGDDFSGYSYDNCDGGDGQINDAHIIELLAALSIIDFDGKQFSSSITTHFHEFGLKESPGKSVIFSDFGIATKNKIQKPLTMMVLLNSYLNNRDLEHRLRQSWAKDRSAILGESFFSSEFFQNYANFKHCFETWLKELADNQLSFDPFNSDEDLKTSDGLTKVKGVTPKYPGINPFRKKGYDLIDKLFGKHLRSLQGSLSAQDTFMELAYVTLNDICKTNLNIQ